MPPQLFRGFPRRDWSHHLFQPGRPVRSNKNRNICFKEKRRRGSVQCAAASHYFATFVAAVKQGRSNFEIRIWNKISRRKRSSSYRALDSVASPAMSLGRTVALALRWPLFLWSVFALYWSVAINTVMYRMEFLNFDKKRNDVTGWCAPPACGIIPLPCLLPSASGFPVAALPARPCFPW
jgi:hypothetical protein